MLNYDLYCRSPASLTLGLFGNMLDILPYQSLLRQVQPWLYLWTPRCSGQGKKKNHSFLSLNIFIILIKITILNSAPGGKTDTPMRGGDGIEALPGTQRSLCAYRGE